MRIKLDMKMKDVKLTAIALFLSITALLVLSVLEQPAETWYVAVDEHWPGYQYDVRFANDQVKEVKLRHAPLMGDNEVWCLVVRKAPLAGGPYWVYDVIEARRIIPERKDANRLPERYDLNNTAGGTA